MEVWFNPSCSRCRGARDQLVEAGMAEPLGRDLDVGDLPRDADSLTEVVAAGRRTDGGA